MELKVFWIQERQAPTLSRLHDVLYKHTLRHTSFIDDLIKTSHSSSKVQPKRVI